MVRLHRLRKPRRVRGPNHDLNDDPGHDPSPNQDLDLNPDPDPSQVESHQSIPNHDHITNPVDEQVITAHPDLHQTDGDDQDTRHDIVQGPRRGRLISILMILIWLISRLRSTNVV